MGCILTFDLGGSKVYVGVLDHSGKLLGEFRGAGGNPTVQGSAYCRETLTKALTDAARKYGFDPDDAAVVTGNAFQSDLSDDAYLRAAFPHADVFLVSELTLNIMLSLKGQPGYTFHSGTGSYVSYFDGAEHFYYGGFGRAFGDLGSGYEIGRQGLNAVVRAMEGCGPQTELYGLVSQRAGFTEKDTFLDQIKKLVNPSVQRGAQYFAEITPMVFQAALIGDTVSREILRANARALSDYCQVLIEKCSCPDEGLFGTSGGVFAARPSLGAAEENLMLRYLEEDLHTRFPCLSYLCNPMPLWKACYACYCRDRKSSDDKGELL